VPAPGAGQCVDTFAACPGWQGQCRVPGVPFHCPCMCAGLAPATEGRRLASAEAKHHDVAQPLETSDQLAGAVDAAVSLARSFGADAGNADAVADATKVAVDAAEDIRDVVEAVQPAQPAQPAAGRALKQTVCVDSFAACPGWQGQCAVPGVSFHCPCMCGGTAQVSGRRLAAQSPHS
jgi:hypothetical protein